MSYGTDFAFLCHQSSVSSFSEGEKRPNTRAENVVMTYGLRSISMRKYRSRTLSVLDIIMSLKICTSFHEIWWTLRQRLGSEFLSSPEGHIALIQQNPLIHHAMNPPFSTNFTREGRNWVGWKTRFSIYVGYSPLLKWLHCVSWAG